MKFKELIKKYKIELIIVLTLFIISLTGVLTFNYLNNNFNDSNICNIYLSSNLIYSLNLNKENKDEARILKIEAKHGEMEISIERNEVKIIKSSCLNKDCIKMGKLEKFNPLICTYNELIIELDNEKDFDTELG